VPAVNQERWIINSSIRGILRILFMIKRLPSQKDDLNTSLAGDAIGTLRRSSTMGFSIFDFACFTSCLSDSQSVRQSVDGPVGFCGPYVSRAKAAHKSSDYETMIRTRRLND